MKTTTLTVRLPNPVRDQIAARADAEQKTQSDYLRGLIAQGLNEAAEADRLDAIAQRLEALSSAVARLTSYIEGGA